MIGYLLSVEKITEKFGVPRVIEQFSSLSNLQKTETLSFSLLSTSTQRFRSKRPPLYPEVKGKQWAKFSFQLYSEIFCRTTSDAVDQPAKTTGDKVKGEKIPICSVTSI